MMDKNLVITKFYYSQNFIMKNFFSFIFTKFYPKKKFCDNFTKFDHIEQNLEKSQISNNFIAKFQKTQNIKISQNYKFPQISNNFITLMFFCK